MPRPAALSRCYPAPVSVALPPVSYVMPVLNEAAHLAEAVASVLSQDYPAEQEIVIALGSSTDATDEIAAGLAAADPRVTLVANPSNDVPIGLNRAIRSSRHPIVVRVDAHAVLPKDYTRRLVTLLTETGAANIGGVMRAVGTTGFQQAVARVYNSPWGLGGGQYHAGDQAGPAESAYLGVFRRDVLESVGLFDETMRRAQDWELNSRIRAAGHLIWFTPDVEVEYRPRSTPSKLARQMLATGVWRGHLVRKQGRTPLKYLAPPAVVLALAASVLTAVLQVFGVVKDGPSALLKLSYLAWPGYLGGVGLVASASLGGRNVTDRVLNAVVLVIVHLSWGLGFLRGWVSGAESVVDTSRVQARQPRT